MKKIFVGFTLLVASTPYAFATDTSPKSGKDDTKEIRELKPSKDHKFGFGEKEQKNAQTILNELMQQHNNAPQIVKASREPTSLATQSALIAKNTVNTKTDSDMLQHLTNVAANTVNTFKQSGVASWYGRQFHGKKTASGERFDMNALTAAHRSLPFGCYVKVTNKDNGQSVIVRINDRGPFHGNRVVDLSYGAAKAIGITKKGMGNVVIERVDDPKTQLTLNNNQ